MNTTITMTVDEDVFKIEEKRNMFYVYRNGIPLEKFYTQLAAINFINNMR